MIIDPKKKQEEIDMMVARDLEIMSTMSEEDQDAYINNLKLKMEELKEIRAKITTLMNIRKS